jgi:hypothetical protein
MTIIKCTNYVPQNAKQCAAAPPKTKTSKTATCRIKEKSTKTNSAALSPRANYTD